MLSCKAKLNEAIIFEGQPYTVVDVIGATMFLENIFNEKQTVPNDCVLIKHVKHVTGRACDLSLPF